MHLVLLLHGLHLSHFLSVVCFQFEDIRQMYVDSNFPGKLTPFLLLLLLIKQSTDTLSDMVEAIENRARPPINRIKTYTIVKKDYQCYLYI